MEQKLIYKKLAAILRKIQPIGKGQRNEQQGFQYRGIDDVASQLHYLFAEEGIIIESEVLDIIREERSSSKGSLILWTIQKIMFRFIAEDGSFSSVILNGEAMDYGGDKSCNKSNSAALKYALTQMFLIPTKELKEQDPDKESHEAKSRAQEEKEKCLALIDSAATVEELSQIKKQNPSLFSKDKEVKSAGVAKFNSLLKKPDDPQP